jgi:hypothetical protein
MRDDIGFVMHALSNVFLRARKLAGRTLWSWLRSKLLQLSKLMLQAFNLDQQLTLRNLRLAFIDLIGKLREARFEAVSFLKFTNALGMLANARIQTR